MKTKQAARFLLIAFILCILICNVYMVAHAHALGYETVPDTVAYANCFLNLLMGGAILLYGFLTEKDAANERTRKFAFVVGAFFSVGSMIAFAVTLLSKA